MDVIGHISYLVVALLLSVTFSIRTIAGNVFQLAAARVLLKKQIRTESLLAAIKVTQQTKY